MKIDIEQKSKELKELVSNFETSWFLGNISNLIDSIGKGAKDQLGELKSPMKQLLYLGGLNITSKQGSNKNNYTNEEWSKIVNLLNEIEIGYDQLFEPKEDELVNEEWIENRKVAISAFLSFFNQGPLNYEEQVIERIERYFNNFNTSIKSIIGIEVNDLIEIYNFIDELHHQKHNDVMIPKKGQQNWSELGQEMRNKRINPDEWMNHMPSHFANLFNFMHDKGTVKRFSQKEIIQQFGGEKAIKFLNFLTISREETEFLYFTEPNPFQFKPIFKVDNDQFQVFSYVHIIHAIYNNLAKILIEQSKTEQKFYKKRGAELEKKIIELFNSFFKKNVKCYQGYSTDEGKGQDILVLVDDIALIIEAKASKRKIPSFSPKNTYDIVKHNFEEVIQKGYDQTYRVKKFFLESKELVIYNNSEKKQKIDTIITKNYHNVFSLIITLERFCQLQTDLDLLLQIGDENDTFPWSVCIDDLEVFLLAIKKIDGNPKKKLVDFLNLREWLHGGIICSDELEICADFLNGKLKRHQIKDDAIIITTPNSPELFDRLYNKGLGFAKEKQIDRKKSDKYIII